MTHRTHENIWSLITSIGSKTVPPRDPDHDNDDEDEEEEEEEDGHEEPAVIREPDE